jgi:uncharacterized protein (TIGR02271 family)
MTQTVIGIFDSFQDANRAVDSLVEQGFSRSDIEVHANDAGYDQTSGGLGGGLNAPTAGTTTTGALGGGTLGGSTGAATDSTWSSAPASPGAIGTDPTLGGSLTGVGALGTPSAVDPYDRDNGLGRGTTSHEGGGMMDKIENFFGRLFGSDDRPEEVGHYTEAVRRGAAMLSIDVRDDSRVDEVRALLGRLGAVDIDERVTQWRATGYGAGMATPATTGQVAAQGQVLPVVQEELAVGKREVNRGGVRAYTRLTETQVSEAIKLREEHATIERRAVDRPADAADLKEAWVEVRETEELPVVSKTARVVEEVVIGKEATERTETVNDTLRHTDVEIERVKGTTGTTGLTGTTGTTIPTTDTTRKPI